MYPKAHPHIDPRRPYNRSAPRTNPPVFVWKPSEPRPSDRYSLQVASDPAFTRPVLSVSRLDDPLYLPEETFENGEYWWKWSTKRSESTVFHFVIEESAVAFEVPPAAVWLERFSTPRPRLYVPPDGMGELRRNRETNPLWPALKEEADSLLRESHDLPEPPYLPDRHTDYPAFLAAFQKAMWESRALARGAEMLALAYLVSGDETFSEAACRRISSLCSWNPDGPTSLANNDEAHMSILWYGISAADWAWGGFSEAQRAVVADHIRRRAEMTYRHMHDLGTYGINRFDSHAGREIVFLAWTLLAFHEYIPDALEMLEWLRPVLCGIWPVWAEDDGGWAEGMSYSLPYVTIMSRFVYILKRGAGIDLFSRPFWAAHAEWRTWCFPSYARWMGFGDHSEVWGQTLLRNADLIELIADECRPGAFAGYIAEMRARAPRTAVRDNTLRYTFSPMRYLRRDTEASDGTVNEKRMLRVFDGVGWAAVRSSMHDPGSDVALIFRSSRFGSISHSHANNNDFILHVAGVPLATPSGYYVGYGSPHHATWVWHTKSHNCATLSDAPQKMRSYESTGSIVNAFENGDLAYFCGVADASYSHYASRYRRHVLYLKDQRVFVMIDEFAARRGMPVSYQWNIHSSFDISKNDGENSFVIEGTVGVPTAGAPKAKLLGNVMYDENATWTLTDGWDPSPVIGEKGRGLPNQYHLRFSTGALLERLNLGVVLRPGWESAPPCDLSFRYNDTERTAVLGETEVAVFREGDVLAEAVIKGCGYVIGDTGITRAV